MTEYIKGWRLHIPQRFGKCSICGKRFQGEQTFARPFTNAAGHNERDVAHAKCVIKIHPETKALLEQ